MLSAVGYRLSVRTVPAGLGCSAPPAGSREPMADSPTTMSSGRMARKHILRWTVRSVLVVAAFVAVLRMGLAERLFYYPQSGPTPVPPDALAAESVWFDSADGTRLHGWFIPAATHRDERERAPTILHVHGNAGNIESHRWFTQHLPPAGFNVFIFDYRGYGQSDGRVTRRGPLIEDTDAALDALLARRDVDSARVGLYGQSLGGAIALNVLAERPEIRAAVLESSFASWRDIAANAVGGDPPNRLGRAIARLLIGDADRPVDAAGRVEAPMLLLHGDADSIVPISHSRRLLQAAKRATLIELPGGEHNSLRDTHPEVDEVMIEFFERHLR
jgi:dipeptidyl aminopeptidase/acylaminoacyl peptidase